MTAQHLTRTYLAVPAHRARLVQNAAASAADSGTRVDRTKDEKDLTQTQQVVVTGNSRREGMLKKEAGYSITTADAYGTSSPVSIRMRSRISSATRKRSGWSVYCAEG